MSEQLNVLGDVCGTAATAFLALNMTFCRVAVVR